MVMRVLFQRSSRHLALALATAVASPALAQQPAIAVLWRDPGPVASLDLRAGPAPAEAPQPPFVFEEEDFSGHSPKLIVRDAAGRRFTVKFGDEVHAEVFAGRLVWACGYQVEPTYYVAAGRLEGVRALVRARPFVAADGSFHEARFKGPHQHWKNVGSWRWDDNAFVGRVELAGLRILTMLLSNWDDKDARDEGAGSNTGVLLDTTTGTRLFAVTDWGTSLGQWGEERTRWNCPQYAAQSPRLLLGTEGRLARFGVFKFAEPISEGLSVDDIGWLLSRLGRITDAQLREGLDAAGATGEEATCFVQAIRDRVERLRRATAGQAGEAQPAGATTTAVP